VDDLRGLSRPKWDLPTDIINLSTTSRTACRTINRPNPIEERSAGMKGCTRKTPRYRGVPPSILAALIDDSVPPHAMVLSPVAQDLFRVKSARVLMYDPCAVDTEP